MNREEKNLQTRQKIIISALQEFGENSYSEASLNKICDAGKISKGIIYHYFKDKDELYLVCVRECFDALTSFMETEVSAGNSSIETELKQYFDARIDFFRLHPLYLKLFCSAVMNPPAHLRTDIAENRKKFDSLNISILTKLLKTVKLCPDVTIEQVVNLFLEYQDFINTRYQLRSFEENTLKEHDEHCQRSLKILLYGVIERK